MFKDIDDGRAVIHQIAVDEADTLMRDTRVQFLLDKLIRQFWLTSDDRSVDVAGATRLGGAPDLPRGTAWPLRPVPPDAAQRAEEMKQHFDWIARHIVRELPFEFLAQIDLPGRTRRCGTCGCRGRRGLGAAVRVRRRQRGPGDPAGRAGAGVAAPTAVSVRAAGHG